MHIIIRHASEEVLEKTLTRARTKLERLSRILDERNYEAKAHVDIQKESGSQHSDQQWQATINIDLAGDGYTASEVSTTPDKAIDRTIQELKTSIKKSKARHATMVKRGNIILKDLYQSVS